MINSLIPKLIRACYEDDKKTVEAISLMIMKKIKKEQPELADEISKTLAYANAGSSPYRAADIQPLPVDRETRYTLAKAEEPIEIPDPILNENIFNQLTNFIFERSLTDKFLKEDITPPTSILLSGMPGVGKTYIAKWLSFKLNLPLISMDLATSISSYLGRSGQNLKNLFDYAKSFPSILFLDELDAIAKRRDDITDLGELKRLVNILLKELETWPSCCIVVAATNHPELLDKAIWRRFDHLFEIPLPADNERNKLFARHLERYINKIDKNIYDFTVSHTAGISAADICKLCEHIKRRIIVNDNEIEKIALEEMCRIIKIDKKEDKIKLCNLIKHKLPSLTIRDISHITGIPATSVTRYLGKGNENE